MAKIEGKFRIKKITRFGDLVEGQNLDLPESDLCFQNENHIIQMEYVRPEDEQKYEIQPGIFTIENAAEGLSLAKIELKKRGLLSTIDNTSKILKEAKTFFSKLHVYDMLNRPKKRGVLLYSKPGMGKTSAVEKFCSDSLTEDPGTVVMVWPTSDVDSDSVSKFLSSKSNFASQCTRMILVIEDIGGGEREEGGTSPVDSGLLNLLDGIGVTFKLPTFIVATTNHPEKLLESLADRPERFDLMIQLNPPSIEEKLQLMEFISKRPLTDEEKSSLAIKGAENFSIAHLGEIAVRSLLHDKTYKQVIEEMIEHSKKYRSSFEEKKSFGLGGIR